MRTTITLDDQLLAEAKRSAAERGSTLGELIEDHLRAGLAATHPQERPAGPIPVFGGRGGLQPGIDITDNASVLEAMDAGGLR